jgi:hypothetical protein
MSAPWAPAFIRTPPPIVPGTAQPHANPASPACAVRTATAGIGSAPPQRTVVPSIVIPRKPPPSRSATPGQALVRDEQVRTAAQHEQRVSLSRQTRTVRSSAASSSTVAMIRAAPPTRSVVCTASGASSTTVTPGPARTSASDSTSTLREQREELGTDL